MALNPKLLKSLASYSDEAADALAFATNYGDDAARLASKYGDDILRVAPKTEHLPFKPSSTQLAERAKANIARRQMSRRVPSTKDTKAGDALSELFDTFTSDTSLKGVSEDLLDTPYTDKFGNAVMVDSAFPELWSYRKNPQMQVIEDSVKRRHLDPPNWAMHFDPETGREFPVPIDHSFDAPKPVLSVDDATFFDEMSAPIPASVYTDADVPSTSGRNGFSAWDYDFTPPTVRKSDFAGYAHQLDGTSIEYPDGFTTPESFAKYYDSLELGYVPEEFNPRSFADESTALNAVRQAQLQGVIPPAIGDFFEGSAYPLDYDYYANDILDDEGPLKKFFATQNASRSRRGSYLGNMKTNQAFDTPMFMTDWWI